MIVFLLLLLFIPANTEAYLDPGTGSYIIQLLIGMFAGMLFATKIFWRRIRIFAEEKVLRIKKSDGSEGKEK